MEQRVHYQVGPPGASQVDAAEGQHEAEPATRGFHLLEAEL